jgi:hypothetical protein
MFTCASPIACAISVGRSVLQRELVPTAEQQLGDADANLATGLLAVLHGLSRSASFCCCVRSHLPDCCDTVTIVQPALLPRCILIQASKVSIDLNTSFYVTVSR